LNTPAVQLDVDRSLTLKFGHKWPKIWPQSGRTAARRVEVRRQQSIGACAGELIRRPTASSDRDQEQIQMIAPAIGKPKPNALSVA
jgi:hypothetical protein